MDTYKIDLLSSGLGGKTFEYEIGDDFFADENGLIQRGSIHTTVACISAGSVFKFQLQSIGTVIVPCDRCLSDLELRIETSDLLSVKFGNEYADEGECVVVPESEGYLDLAHFIYEFIVLSMPIACCHEPGKCDEAMMQELSRHQSTRSGVLDNEDDNSTVSADSASDTPCEIGSEEPIDSRWEALKKLINKP